MRCKVSVMFVSVCPPLFLVPIYLRSNYMYAIRMQYLCMYLCAYLNIFPCMYICAYIYTHMQTYIQRERERREGLRTWARVCLRALVDSPEEEERKKDGPPGLRAACVVLIPLKKQYKNKKRVS